MMAILKPLFSMLQLFNTLLSPLMMVLELILKPFYDLEEAMTMLYEVFDEAIQAVNTVFKTLFDTIKALLPGSGMDGIKDVFRQLQRAIRDVIGQFYVLVGTLAKFFGADTFLKKLIENLTPQQGAVAAPTNASISSVESIAKEAATAAATAGGSAETEQERTLGGVVKELESIRSGGDSRFSQLVTITPKHPQGIRWGRTGDSERPGIRQQN